MSSGKFVPAGATIQELEQKAAECEQQATAAQNSAATFALRQEAAKLRAWARALRIRLWTA